jgi:peptidoglycan/LPS O-acetylase OafA/YrhL
MFGIFRYCLATIVVIGHLWPSLVPGMGSYAVFGFYILSGYLMTLVLSDVYGFSKDGTLKFIINRLLRIFPPYLFIFFISIIIYFSIKPIPEQFYFFKLPLTFEDWLRNILLFDIKSGGNIATPMLVGVAWTLYVELVFYFLMAIILVRNKTIALIWFFFSLVITTYMVIDGYDIVARYYSVIAGSLPFSTGAMIYFYRSKLIIKPQKLLQTVGILFLVNIFLTRVFDIGYLEVPGLYISYALSALLIVGCININAQNLPIFVKRIDKLLGDISYNVYLCHWPVAIFISSFFFAGSLQRSSPLFFISIFFINTFSLLVFYLIEKKINIARNIIKKNI